MLSDNVSSTYDWTAIRAIHMEVLDKMKEATKWSSIFQAKIISGNVLISKNYITAQKKVD